jgi:hypothetical protein
MTTSVGLAWFDLLGTNGLIFGFFSSLLSMILAPVWIAYKAAEQRAALDELTRYTSPAAIGPLMEATKHLTHNQTRLALNSTLVEALSKLKASDSSLMPGETRQRLYRSLASFDANAKQASDFPRDIDYWMALLHAVEQVGDGRAVPALEKVVKATYRMPLQVQFQEAARHSLNTLRARLDDTGEGLLRASVGSVEANGLVRPSVEAGPSEQKALLRPAGE